MAMEALELDYKMVALAESFPSLANASVVRFWHAKTLDRWASDTPISKGELVTVQFLLAVWDPHHVWECGRFDLMNALTIWDIRHRSAFLAWAKEPWWA